MRVPAAQARAISRRAKTQIRVPVDSQLTGPLRPVRRHSAKPFNPTVGDIIPIDGADQRVHCKIVYLERRTLGTLTLEDAQAEGHQTVEEFEIAWVERHDRHWLDKQITDLIQNGEPEHQALETRPLWAASRYEHRWQTRQVWVLTVEPFGDIPYLLPGLPEEPEGIPADRIKPRWGVKAARRYQDAKDMELRTRDAKQLARRVKLMKLNNPDAPEIAVIEEQLLRLEQRYSQAA